MLEHLIDITDSHGDDELWDPILKRLLPGMLDLIVEANEWCSNKKKRKFKWFCF